MKTTLTKAAAFTLLAAGAWTLPGAPAAQASTIVALATPAPTPGSEIGARIRWGATGAEAGLLDGGASPDLMGSNSLNPGGAPVWSSILGQARNFRIGFTSATGLLSLGVDFNNDSDFLDSQESTSTASFTAPGATSYAGQGFSYLTISISQANANTATLSNLVINGTAINAFGTTAAGFTEAYFGVAGAPIVGDWTITGSVTFNATGRNQESPAFNFRFRQPGEPTSGGGGNEVAVPAPAGLAVLGLGLLGLAALRRRG